MTKKKILLVADIPNWAFDTIASAMTERLQNQFNFIKIYSSQYKLGMSKCFDETYFMQWNDFIGKGQPEEFMALITSHNYHLLHNDIAQQIIPRFRAVAVSSMELYEKISILNSNTVYCPHGVDTNLFSYIAPKRREKFIIGHVGQRLDPHAGLDGAPYDMKGVRHVLNKVREKLKDHPEIEFKINHNTPHDARPLAEMPKFYEDVDIQLCTSFREGTPFPALEAAAVGRPLISTRVGCVPEIIKHGENGLLVDSYNNVAEASRAADQIVDHILFLNKNREICKEMGKKNRLEIEKSWTWDKVSKNYLSLFDQSTQT